MQTQRQNGFSAETRPESPVLSGFSSYDAPDQDAINSILVQYNFVYILDHVVQAYPGMPEEDAKDVAQEVSISLWRKLETGPVKNPPAYIAQMIRNRCIDRFRRCQRPSHVQMVPLSENWDTLEGEAVAHSSLAEADPASAFEERVAADVSVKEIVDAVFELPSRQRKAVSCTLLEKADDLCLLNEAFRAHSADIGSFHWPANRAEKQLLQASLYAARFYLARRLCVNLAHYKHRKQ